MFFTNTVAAQNSSFVKRTTSDGMYGNKWWYSSSNKFYPNPTLRLPNCTTYAYGRLLEINNGVNVGLPTGDAGEWYERTTAIEKTEALEPKLGAVICFSKAGADGHVAVVEDILPNGDVLTSNSAYGGEYFYMETYSKANGYNKGAYKFQGFIYANLNSENYFDSGRYVSGDFNGDGKDDIATMYDYGNGKMSLLVFSSTGSSFNTWEQWYSVPSNEIYLANNVTGRMVSGDFNGDGKDDIATMYDYGKGRMSLHVFLSTGSSFSTCNTWYSAPSNEIYLAENVTGRMVAGDFNGDGKDDIATMYDYGEGRMSLHVFSSTGSSFSTWSPWYSVSGNEIYIAENVTGRMVAGDFNGDGKADISTMYDYGKGRMSLHVFSSTGSSFSTWSPWYSVPGNEIYIAKNVTGRMVAGDFNGDGKADISTMYDYGNGSMKLLNFMSRGNSFTSWKPWYGVPTGQYYVDKIMGKIIVRQY